MKIDNFALTNHQTCPAKYDLRINQGWTVRRKSAALGFGGALHAGLAAWYKYHAIKAATDAIEAEWPQEVPVDDYRTKQKCLQTMLEYIATYPGESFNVVGKGDDAMVEVSFSLETGLYLSCFKCGIESGRYNGTDVAPICSNCHAPLEPIEYGGIFDTLVEQAGQLYVLEHKSTSQLGQYYFSQFKPNNQITGYVWAAERLTGRKVGGAIVNAIGVYKSQATKFDRHITSRNATDISIWLKDLQSVCEEIQQHRRNRYFPRRTAACQLYGSCEFHSVHVLSTEVEQVKRLENDYIKDIWDHERRDVPST